MPERPDPEILYKLSDPDIPWYTLSRTAAARSQAGRPRIRNSRLFWYMTARITRQAGGLSRPVPFRAPVQPF
jgi:hypothetical protein